MKSVVILLAIVFSVCTGAAQSESATRAMPSGVKEAIIDVLAGEDGIYAARAKYSAVVQKFGAVAPYAFVRNAESSQALALQTYLKKYGMTAPTDRYAAKMTAPDTLATAAAEAVRLEEKIVESYERLLRIAGSDSELTRIVQNLLRLKKDSHLAVFKSAVDHGGSLTKDQIRARVWQKYVTAGAK